MKLISLALVGFLLAGPTPRAVAAPADAAARQLQSAYAALEAAIMETSAGAPDVAALADSLGRDPDRMFAWVRDETRWVPYRGALRDHAGVLLDRLGNSLDRSLLLYALLRHVGADVRLAQAQLSTDQARDLLSRVRPAADVSPGQADRRPSTDGVEQFARRHNLDVRMMRASMEQQAKEAERVGHEAARRIKDQAAFLTSKVPEILRSGSPLAAEASPLEALQDHWWVQARRAGEWVDYDVLLPDSRPGQRLASPAGPLAPRSLIDLGEARLHSVQIRVVVETVHAAGRQEVQVLSHTVLPSEVLGTPIILRHYAPRWPKTIDLSGGPGAFTRIREAVLAQHEWIPILSIGERSIFHSAFTDSGEVRATSRSALAQGAEVLGERVGGLLGSGGQDSGRSRPGDASADRLAAEWIEYEVRAPGVTTRTIRRQIFDLLGPAARSGRSAAQFHPTPDGRIRRGLALLGETQIMLWPAQASPQYITLLAARRWLAVQPLVMEFAHSGRTVTRDDLMNRIRRADAIPGPLYDLALARGLLSPVRTYVYLHTPTILSFHRMPTLDGDRGFVMLESFDIVANDVAIRPGGRREPGMIRLQQGVADTVLESLIPLGGRRRPNVSDLLAVHRRDRDWVVIRGTDDRAWRSLRLSDDARARIAAALASGAIVVVPREALPIGRDRALSWWTVDPQTGMTLGLGETGWGDAATEYTLTKEEAVAYVATAGGFVDWMICAFKHEGLPQGTKAAGKCFLAGFCLMIGGALVLGTTEFTGGVAFPVASAAVAYLCTAIRTHL